MGKLVNELVPKRWYWGYGAQDPAINADYGRLTQCEGVQSLLSDWRDKKKRFYLCHAGRRSGKTEIFKRMVIEYALTHSDKRIILGAPVYSQTHEIFWDDLKKIVPAASYPSIKEAEMRMVLFNGTSIRCVGLDVPQRIEGSRIDLILIDEFADIKESVLTENVLPAISDTKGIALITGTPNGASDHFHRLVMSVKSGNPDYADWGVYTWTTAETKGSEEPNRMKAYMNEVLWKQEFLGQFISSIGKAYAYEADVHKVKKLSYQIDLPMDICCDFNVNFMSWPLCQADSSRNLSILDEVTTRHSSLYVQIEELKKRLSVYLREPRRNPIRFYGDATGQWTRDPAAVVSSWDTLRAEFSGWNIKWNYSKTNPRIGDRLFAVNSRFKTADGSVHLKIASQCRELILDFETISFKDYIKGDKEKAGTERSHSSDAIGYYIYKEFPPSGKRVGARTLNRVKL